MRLRRLKLENWRGIESCEVRFADGVTIVEGPNEAGKSTLVEALLTLIRELDSSKKQAIRAVTPVGRDVGSVVIAEIETGPYRFVYSKTYNRQPQTTLDINAPRREQLTGREAHERVDAILEETVDLGLWEALLTEQGGSLEPADLKDRAGLANALDEAAGHATTGVEDTDLFDAARSEYERYYTLKAGKARFAALEQEFDAAAAARDTAATALADVEREAVAHERLSADVRRRREAIPDLQARLAGHEKAWQGVARLRQEQELAESRLATAREQKLAAEKAREERKALVDAAAADANTLAGLREKQQPLVNRAEGAAGDVDIANRITEDRRRQRNAARERIETVRKDLAYLEDRELLVGNERRLKEYAAVSAQMKQTSRTLGDTSIDDAGLEAIRTATHDLDKARSKRDLAATTVTVHAERSLEFGFGGEEVSLAEGELEQRDIASGSEIRFPGVATVVVAPPRTAAELEADFSEAETALASALARNGVRSLGEAIEQNEARRSAQAEMQRLKARASEVLADQTAEEIGERLQSLRQRCEAFLEQRSSRVGLPETPAAARDAEAEAARALAHAEADFEEARQRETDLRSRHVAAEAALRESREALIGLEATQKDRQQRLAIARETIPDDVLEDRLREAVALAGERQATAAEVRARLDELAPESIEALYVNAKEALARAERELADAERDLAVLDDRLERAQADGRFEALEAAERTLQDVGAELDATRRRAAAAERLWMTLNRHRDATRQAYVQPLKEAVERLGRIVFGTDFEVTIGDDWSIETRTLDGITLPFDSLSIGAREQLGILVRLAAARVVSQQGGVPLLIDDALGFSDPSRLETMGAAIAAAGKDCQVIVLTCTPGRFTHVGNAEVVKF